MLDNEANWLSPRLRASLVRFANSLVVIASLRPRMTVQLVKTFLTVVGRQSVRRGSPEMPLHRTSVGI